MSEKYQRADEALKYTSVSDDTMESLKYPKTSLKVSIPVRLDNGDLKVFEGYRVNFNGLPPYNSTSI